MDFSRPSSPPSIHIHDCNNINLSRRLTGQTVSGSPFSASHGPMLIPSKKIEDFAPPPLPPPRRIDDLENGHDAGWLFAHLPGVADPGTLAPINPGSSLFGGHRRPVPVSRIDPMSLDDLDSQGRVGISPQSPKTQIGHEFPALVDESYRRNSVFTPFSEPILRGERDFSRKCVQNSSDAYDKHVLSKIGKPPSPRQSVSLGSDRLSITTLPLHVRSAATGDGGGFKPQELRWHNGLHSNAVSPSTKPSWKDYTDYRSPSIDSNAPSVDFEISAYAREFGRRPTGTMTPQYEDSSSVASRSNRGSYDQGTFSDAEGDFAADESALFRQIHFNDRPPAYLDAISLQSKQQGMKRRASSPPHEPIGDDRHTIHPVTTNGDGQRRTAGNLFAGATSPGSRSAMSHGSLSSASSASLRTYASSVALSVGGSSMTSVSSYDRLSPGGLSPNSDLEQSLEKPTLSQPSPPRSSTCHTVTRGAQCSAPQEQKTISTMQKMSVQTTLSKPSGPKIGGRYICECCPKKPKKFDTQEELRAHELEKQYSCQFCNNRFKNKNEAERHRNSLHLRRHSWSCAALSSYQAAFHPSMSSTSQTNARPSHDTCGYCGDEFPNFPQPDWNRRFEHLTTLHKFGECNNSKKFYRADHFRQHLKHSHAGTSGKWTNILENACMKEESQAEARLGSIGEQGRRTGCMNGGRAGSTSSITGAFSNTIDEASDES